MRAADLLVNGGWSYQGCRIRVDTRAKHSMEYDAIVLAVEPQDRLPGWVRITHRRCNGDEPVTINVLPPSTEVTLLD